MVTELRVVNDCLAIMGEAPLTSLNESHAFKAAARNALTRVSGIIQSKGWWYNMETLNVAASPVDNRITLPNDAGTVLPPYRFPNVVQRGRFMYDLDRGTDIFPEGTTYEVRLVRTLPIDLVPATVAEYIAGQTVLEFQQQYDGDQTKTRNQWKLVYGDRQEGTLGLKGEAEKEHIRYRRVNLIASSERLHRVTSRINYSRRPG